MCTNYTPSTRHEIAASRFGVAHLPSEQWPDEVFPGYRAPIVRRGDAGQPSVCELAQFGLVPRWAQDAVKARALSRGTYNARSETAASKPSFGAPWRERQWALVPMQSFFEPCWEETDGTAGRPIRWKIARADGEPFAVAGLWERWSDVANGQPLASFSLLTINADGHALLGRMHRPGDEKRMLVVVPPTHYTRWLHATTADAMGMMQAIPAEQLLGVPSPKASATDIAPLPATLPLF